MVSYGLTIILEDCEFFDLSSLTFHTLSTEISDLSSDTSMEISVLRAEKGSELEDLSSLTFHTLSTEIRELSRDTSREIRDLF